MDLESSSEMKNADVKWWNHSKFRSGQIFEFERLAAHERGSFWLKGSLDVPAREPTWGLLVIGGYVMGMSGKGTGRTGSKVNRI